MLDYVVRTSPLLSSVLPRGDDDVVTADGDAAAGNPLQMSPSAHENEHPNFIKKYSAKKVRLPPPSSALLERY
jgi:hypothetical protein